MVTLRQKLSPRGIETAGCSSDHGGPVPQALLPTCCDDTRRRPPSLTLLQPLGGPPSLPSPQPMQPHFYVTRSAPLGWMRATEGRLFICRPRRPCSVLCRPLFCPRLRRWCSLGSVFSPCPCGCFLGRLIHSCGCSDTNKPQLAPVG
jgi:hypothetical protein